MNLMKYIPEYEKLTGNKVSPQLAEVLELLDDTSKQFEAKGREDAAQNRPAASDETFQDWGKKVFDGDTELVEVFTGLMKKYYMNGYKGGKA